METLSSFWSSDPCDLLLAPSLWDPQYVESSGPTVSCAMWTELSPHIQRNKMLHDTLLQREEQLARLQEENNKLREFLNSSFVRDLEEKAKKLLVDGRRKRNFSSSDIPISKRVCRNLTSEFCSDSEPSEPSLDLWVLKTLGLKDKDTIDRTTDDNVPDHHHSPENSCIHHTPADNLFQTSSNPSRLQDSKNTTLENLCLDFPISEVCNQPPGQKPLQKMLTYSPSKRLHFSCSDSTQDDGEVSSPSTSTCDLVDPGAKPDLAFSMSLSPNHSLKTHSFPHGQAFVRRDTQGRCNFTWVPRVQL